MRPLSAAAGAGPAGGTRAPRPGPGPSRTAYRLSRIWKKQWVRRAAPALPLACLALLAGRLATDPVVRAAVASNAEALMNAVSARPEFAVRGVRVTGAAAPLARAVTEAVRLPPGASSLTIDLDAVRERVAALGGVRSARVALGADGVLLVAVDERVPEALWRDDEGKLWLVGRDGVAVAPAGERAAYPTLPVVIGDGAQAAMEEALALFRAAPEIRPRLRALVRVGQRRWNVDLDRDLTIMLPADEPEAALARVMALHYGEELLDRDLAVIDMRVGERPTLRLTPRAAELLRLRDAAGPGPGKET